MNQIYSKAYSHDYFEPSLAKIHSLLNKIQFKWQNVLLPIRKAPLFREQAVLSINITHPFISKNLNINKFKVYNSKLILANKILMNL